MKSKHKPKRKSKRSSSPDPSRPVYKPPPFSVGQLVKLSREGEQRSIGAFGASHAGLVVAQQDGYVTVAQTVVCQYAAIFWEPLLQSERRAKHAR